MLSSHVSAFAAQSLVRARRFKDKPVAFRPSWYYLLFGRGQLYEEMEFHVARIHFLNQVASRPLPRCFVSHLRTCYAIAQLDLPLDFDFSKYLRRCMSEYIVGHIDVKESTWLIMVVILLLNYARGAIVRAAEKANQQEAWGELARVRFARR